jgi:hypothetical protein
MIFPFSGVYRRELVIRFPKTCAIRSGFRLMEEKKRFRLRFQEDISLGGQHAVNKQLATILKEALDFLRGSCWRIYSTSGMDSHRLRVPKRCSDFV